MQARIEAIAYLCFSVVILLGVGVTLSVLQRRRRWSARAARLRMGRQQRANTPGSPWPCECPCWPCRLHAFQSTPESGDIPKHSADDGVIVGCLFGSQWQTRRTTPAAFEYQDRPQAPNHWPEGESDE